jgi:hypothetical protein
MTVKKITGLYEVTHHGVEMELRVSKHPHGDWPDGLLLEYADGARYTVTDATVAELYLKRDQAVKIRAR